MKQEIIIFNGIRFYRYPESPRRAHRLYFKPGIGHCQKGFQALHQEIWKASHGPIPPGYEVHHKDGNPLNNVLDNLTLLTEEEHHHLHANQPRSEAQIQQHINRIEKAKAWHASEEGLAWHAQHGRESWRNRQPIKRICTWCGIEYDSMTNNGNEKFCSPYCRNKEREPRTFIYRPICEECGEVFPAVKKASRFCSRRCSKRFRDKHSQKNS